MPSIIDSPWVEEKYNRMFFNKERHSTTPLMKCMLAIEFTSLVWLLLSWNLIALILSGVSIAVMAPLTLAIKPNRYFRAISLFQSILIILGILVGPFVLMLVIVWWVGRLD